MAFRYSVRRLRRQKQKEKEARVVRTVTTWLWLAGLLLVVGLVVGVILLLRFRRWTGSERFSLVVVDTDGANVRVISLEPASGEAVVFVLADDLVVPAVYGYGSYRVSSLRPLGGIDGLGDRLLEESVESLFGWPVFGVLVTGSEEGEETLGWFRDLAWARLWQKPTLIWLDNVRFYREVGNLREDKLRVINLADLSLAYATTQADGAEVFMVDIARFDAFLRRFPTSGYRDEGVRVAIVNTTSQDGLAHRAGRLLLNSGADVVSMTDEPTDLSQSFVGYSDHFFWQDTVTGRLIDNLFEGLSWRQQDLGQYRADVTLFLGEDYRDYWEVRPE